MQKRAMMCIPQVAWTVHGFFRGATPLLLPVVGFVLQSSGHVQGSTSSGREKAQLLRRRSGKGVGRPAVAAALLVWPRGISSIEVTAD